MNIEDIITLEDNKEYLILDIIKYDNEEYMYCVMIDEFDNVTNEYIYVKCIQENNDIFVEEVEDKVVLENIIEIFSKKINDEQDV